MICVGDVTLVNTKFYSEEISVTLNINFISKNEKTLNFNF